MALVFTLYAVFAAAVLYWIVWSTREPPEKQGERWWIVACPLADTEEEALDWFYRRNAKDIKLYVGPDGLVRGTGKIPP